MSIDPLIRAARDARGRKRKFAIFLLLVLWIGAMMKLAPASILDKAGEIIGLLLVLLGFDILTDPTVVNGAAVVAERDSGETKAIARRPDDCPYRKGDDDESCPGA